MSGECGSPTRNLRIWFKMHPFQFRIAVCVDTDNGKFPTVRSTVTSECDHVTVTLYKPNMFLLLVFFPVHSWLSSDYNGLPLSFNRKQSKVCNLQLFLLRQNKNCPASTELTLSAETVIGLYFSLTVTDTEIMQKQDAAQHFPLKG